MDNLSRFVESLQELMVQRNITPENIHQAANLSLNVIYAWQRKAAMPNLISLVTLADYFNCSVDYLCGCVEQPSFVKSDTPSSFPERFRLLLTEKGITRRRLSAQTKISMCGIQRYLTGTGRPLLDNLIKLAVFFDYSIDYLLGRTDDI